MQYRVGVLGLIEDEKGRKIGPGVDRHTVLSTGRFDGFDGVYVRLWNSIITSGKRDLDQGDINNNVQFRMQAADASAFAQAILDKLDTEVVGDK